MLLNQERHQQHSHRQELPSHRLNQCQTGSQSSYSELSTEQRLKQYYRYRISITLWRSSRRCILNIPDFPRRSTARLSRYIRGTLEHTEELNKDAVKQITELAYLIAGLLKS